jgi:hypothetical protein
LEEEVNGIKEDLIKMKACRSREHSQVMQPLQKVNESDYLNMKNEL